MFSRYNYLKHDGRGNRRGFIKNVFWLVKNKIKMHFEAVKRFLRKVTIDSRNKKKLKNCNPSILSMNCNGCIISHDLGLRFNSQFVNLWLSPKDFLEYLEHLDYYNSLPIQFISSTENNPVGVIGGLTIHFTHYSSEEEAAKKWDERKKRIIPDNLFVMMTDQEGCTHDDMVRFDNLPFQHKVIFTHLPHSDIRSSFYIKGFEDKGMVGQLNGWTGMFSLHKWYDQFDYVNWLNGN
ncbi:MAG: DUF1919 domain-containing protein [Victivallales bacterium]|nr:DUF1919 domain-containing protein [Victivallales bacterium]